MGAEGSRHIVDLCMGHGMFWGLSKFEELLGTVCVCLSVYLSVSIYLCGCSTCVHMCTQVYMLVEVRGQSQTHFLSSFYLKFFYVQYFYFSTISYMYFGHFHTHIILPYSFLPPAEPLSQQFLLPCVFSFVCVTP